MDVEVGIWNRLTRVVIFLAVGCFLLAVGASYIPLFRQNEYFHREIQKLDREIKEKNSWRQQYTWDIHGLRNDARYVERIAREVLGYARPGETLIHFVTVER